MTANGLETGWDALRALAQLVLRDGIDGGHLQAYVRGLLNNHLVELPAFCRCEATKAAQRCAGQGAVDVAGELCEIACRLDRMNSGYDRSAIPAYLCKSFLNAVSEQRQVETICGQNQTSQGCRRHVSWTPELLGAIAFTLIGFVVMQEGYGDFTLRVMAASICGSIGFTHTAVAVRSAWRNAHSEHRPTQYK